MAVGRKPKPTHLKQITGNPGGRKLNKAEPKPKSSRLPQKPAGLCPVASEYWDRLRGNIIDLGLLASVDEDTMEQMARLYADLRILQADVDKNGHTYESVGTEGQRLIKANPAVSQLRAAQSAFLRTLTEFGMTPSSRSRIKVGDEAHGDKDDEAERHFG